MSARSLHEVATGKTKKAHRTGAKVRRNSFKVGDREHRIWRRFDRSEFNARMRAAEQHDRDNKQPGKRNGPIGAIGLEVYRELMRMVCWKTGRLDPSIATLCERTKRCTDAVVSALAPDLVIGDITLPTKIVTGAQITPIPVNVSGGQRPYNIQVTGLPAGWTYANGQITGAATNAGEAFTIVIRHGRAGDAGHGRAVAQRHRHRGDDVAICIGRHPDHLPRRQRARAIRQCRELHLREERRRAAYPRH